MSDTFGGRLAAQFAAGRRLCVGIDPHDSLLDAWELPRSAEGAEHMGRVVVELAHDHAACLKPQIAFFERFGAAGYVALERVLSDAREAGVLTIADVKRGDIGSTFAAYAEAWLGAGSPLESDAMTVHAYQGLGSLAAAFAMVDDGGKGMFVLAATSNPEAREVQRARVAGEDTLAKHMMQEVAMKNQPGSARVGSYGVVLGATLDLADYGVDLTESRTPVLPILAPGFGHQGAQPSDVNTLFGALAEGVLLSESRSILGGGKSEILARIEQSTDKIREAYA